MKGKIIAIVLALCASVFIGCTSDKENDFESNNTYSSEEGTYEIEETTEVFSDIPSTDELVDIQHLWEYDVPDEELSLIQKVLLNKVPFADGKKIVEKRGVYEGDYKRNGFIVVDLDHDGIDEVCIDYPPGEFLILHEENNQVYSYVVGYNGFWPVYTDGTFVGSGATASKSIFCGNVTFVNNRFNSEIIVGQQYEGSMKGQVFFKGDNKTEITLEEYSEIMSQYARVEAERYDFSLENILQYVN